MVKCDFVFLNKWDSYRGKQHNKPSLKNNFLSKPSGYVSWDVKRVGKTIHFVHIFLPEESDFAQTVVGIITNSVTRRNKHT